MRPLFFAGVIAVFCGVGFFIPASASEGVSDPNLRMDFTSYENVMRGMVLVNGRSTRRPAPRPIPPLGSRIFRGDKAMTRWESNRVLFHLFSAGGQDLVYQAMRDLVAIPAARPLSDYPSDERLAYWLNIRNLAVFIAVMEAYPIGKIDRLWGEIYKDKRLEIAGQHYSIFDIENHVKANWPDPVVIYGFYNGSIGGPNLRARPYDGEKLWEYLSSNAKDFVNSLRGLWIDGDDAEVSVFYDEHRDMFPNFARDLKAHMLNFAEGNLKEDLEATNAVKVEISDWYAADLFMGNFTRGSSSSVSAAGMLSTGGTMTGASGVMNDIMQAAESNSSISGYPDHVQRFLQDWIDRNFDKDRATVTISEIDSPRERVESRPQDERNNNNYY